MGLRDLYTALEDKWYGALDKADNHVPIYKIIDPIDKAVPSFVLFIAAIAIIAAFLILPALLPTAQQVSVTLSVANEEGNPLEGATVDYTIAGTIDSRKTNAQGKVLFNAPFESSVDISIADTTIKGVEYAGATVKITLGKEPTYSKKISLAKKAAAIERTIIFQNSAGERITGEAIRIRLSCQNPVAKLLKTDAIDEDRDGEIKVTEPAGCRLLQATIIAPAKFKQKSYNIANSAQTLQLEELDIAKGSVRVKIKDESGNLLTETNFSVKLLETDGSPVNEKYSRNYGEAFFTEVKIGTYNASVADDAGDYALATAGGIEVKVNETTQADVIASKTVKAKITVQVIDKASKKAIANATVKLLNPDGRILDEESTGSEAKSIVFSLRDALTYTLQAAHSDYLYDEVKVEKATADTAITIELLKLTALNSGRVEVKAVDEEGKAVAKAKVKLRFLESGMLVPIEPDFTDTNGMAYFKGVKAGSYYAYAEKFPASGDNKADGKEIDIRETTRFTIQMFIGKTNVTVKAVDEDNKQVPEAEAEFFAESGDSLGKIALTNGTGQFELKADKRVFVIVSHANSMPVQTMPAQLFPSQKIEFVAKMEPKLVLGDPKVQFEGVFDSSGKQVQMLKAGNKYIVKFKLSIPSSGNFRQAGFHFRVGDEQLSANDPLVIKDVIAGGISSPLRGTSFSQAAGYAEDEQNLTEGDAKWVNIFWNELQPMNYYFGFEIRVKSQVMPYTKLSMHYRAWAIDESGDHIRAPFDSALGVVESTAEKQALYAEKFTVQFLEGSPAKCEELFCYSGESILDEDKGLFVMEPYQLNAGAAHKLTFDILNNSERQYSSAKLYITAVGLTIDSYKIKNADAREISAALLATKKIEEIDLGEFTKGKSINSIVHFNASAIGNASIEIKIIADARAVFLRTITAAVESEKQMRIAVEPPLIPAYIANKVQISASEDSGGQTFAIDNALVRLTITHPNKVTQFFKNNTNGLGKTSFDLPALQPSTKIVIEVEKPGYYAAPIEIIVASDVLRFEPSELQATLDTRGRTEYTFITGLENLIGKDVKITDVQLAGEFRGLLDNQTMINFSRQQIGSTLRALESETVQFFKAKLSENAADLLLKNEKLKGEYIITAMNEETLAFWDAIVPLTVNINIGGTPDNAPCLTVSKSEWKGVTMQNKATIEFEVQNNCMAASNFVGLDNLQAKMEWESDAIGIVELTLTEAESGASNTTVLRPQVWANLFKGIRPEATYYAMLTFTPKTGHLGETAKFSVNIDGQIMTDSGMAFVGSAPKSIKSEVKIINLESCVSFPNSENAWIKPSQKETTVTIDSSSCGNTDVEFALCWQDPGCRGGTSEGYIQLSTDKFKLTPDKSQKEVLVSRGDLPGAYGVTVYARIPGATFRKIGEIIVNIEGREGLYWDLDKYTFSIIGVGASDAATVSNRMLEEEVQVTASVCDWGEAQKDKEYSPIGAAAGAGIGSYVGNLLGAHIVAGSIASGVASSFGITAVTQAVGTTTLAGAYSIGYQAAYSSAYDAAYQNILSEGFSKTAIQAASTEAAASGASGAAAAGVDVSGSAIPNAANSGIEAGVGAGKMPGFIGPVIGGIITYAITGDPIAAAASGVGGYIGMAICGPVCGVIGSIIGSLLGGMFGADPCAEDLTQPLPDFVINLAGSKREYHGEKIDSDALGIAVKGYENDIEGVWNTVDRDVAEGKEKVGVLFTNMRGVEEVEPIYAIATFKAKEHIHGDITHQNAHVKLGGSSFAPYAVPDSDTIEHTQRFHLRFKTKNIPQTIPPISYDSYECIQGTMIGRTGKGALPRVKFGWSWDDSTGIAINSCDQANPDYIYCDATQFAIELSKRIQKIEQFMKANNYQFSCPTNGVLDASLSRSNEFNQRNGSQTIDANKLGMRSMNFNYSNETLTVNVVVENKTSAAQDATATVYVYGSSGNNYEETCTQSSAGIGQNQTATLQCSFSNVVQHSSAYHIGASISSNSTDNIDSTVLLSILIAAEPAAQQHCWLPPSTDYYQGLPGFVYYIDSGNPRVGKYVTDQSIVWTADVRSAADLVKLTHFKAYLIQDGFGKDFRQDFAEFYTTSSFFDAPAWFADDPSGKMADYFADDNAMAIAVKYTWDSVLAAPGLYNVDIGISYNNDNWALYDAFARPNARTFVQLHRIREPLIDSIFYYMPFDGYVGLGTSNGRQFYGMNYINIKEPVAVVENPQLLRTDEVIGSNSRFILVTDIEQDLKKINSVAADRGFIMDVKETRPYSMEMVFSPNYATPVIMKMNHAKSDEPFAALYELREFSTPVETGSNLTFWEGAGQCLSYEGVPVAESFDFRPDREANEKDPLYNWQFAYAVDWPKADYAGNVYLKSVFYSPANSRLTLRILYPEQLRFISPNMGESLSIELKGIQGMLHNSTENPDSVDKLQDVFDLVESGHVCVTNSGTRSAFWWNPRTLYETAGAKTSVKAFEQSLVAGQNCIGYGG